MESAIFATFDIASTACVNNINFFIVASPAIAFITVVTFIDTFAFLSTMHAELFIAFDTFIFVAIITDIFRTTRTTSHFRTAYAVVPVAYIATMKHLLMLSVNKTEVAGVFQATIASVKMGSIIVIIFIISFNPFIILRKTLIAFKAADRPPISPHFIVSFNECVELRIGGWFLPPQRWKL